MCRPPGWPLRLALLAVAATLAAPSACTRSNPGYLDEIVDGPFAPSDGPMLVDQGSPAPDRLLADAPDPAQPDQTSHPKKPKLLDVLLVVDNTGGGMSVFQQRLASSLGAFVDELGTVAGLQGLRIGVTTTDMGTGRFTTTNCTASGDAGRLVLQPNCPTPKGSVRYFEKTGGSANVSGSFRDAVSCAVRVGEVGCGFEQPLEAMRAALSGGAQGFLRQDAALAVVILTNEDDCSATDDSLFNPNDSTLGPYASYRCFQYGVLCDGQQPPRQTTVLQNCVPGQSKLWSVQSRYVDYLTQLKPTGWLSVLTLAAEPPKLTQVQVASDGSSLYWRLKPVCLMDSATFADPAIRLRQFAELLGSSGSFASICQSSYQQAFKTMAASIRSAF